MNFKLLDLNKWFYYEMSNYKSNGLSFLLTKCDATKRHKGYTNLIKLVKLVQTNNLEDIVLPIRDVISSFICNASQNFVIYNYRKNEQQFFCSTLTERKIKKMPNTTIIPWGERIIIAEHQGVSFEYTDTIYECYDGHLNLIWRYLQHGFLNDGAYKIYKDYIEIGADNKIFFNEEGILEEVKGLSQTPIEQSDWYVNDENYSFLKQVCEKCISHQALSKCLFNGKEYVLYCNSPTNQYIVKFDTNLNLLWKLELPYCLGANQLLYSNGIYFFIGNKTNDSFYICTINENGEILEQSENIKANEFFGYTVNEKIIIFYNRIDNLTKSEKELLNDGVMIANGYCLIVNA